MAVKIAGTVRSGSEYISVEADSIEEFMDTVNRLRGSAPPATSYRGRKAQTNKSTSWSCPEHGNRSVKFREDKGYFYCAMPLVENPTRGSFEDWCGHTSFNTES